MATTLRLLDRGARVVLVEKESKVGGNSAKASSGINSVGPEPDTMQAFAADIARSAKQRGAAPAHDATLHDETARDETVRAEASHDETAALLAAASRSAVTWLRERVGVDLSKISQLGGHSHARTRRPASGSIGQALTAGLWQQLEGFVGLGQLHVMLDCRVSSLLRSPEEDRVVGIAYHCSDGREGTILAPSTVLATGGYAGDLSSPYSVLALHRPDLLHLSSTNGAFAAGEGLKMATALGAATVDLDKVQIHPTGFVAPADPKASTKVLCAEAMRGVGGVLLTPDGRRFVDELATRNVVVAAQLATGFSEFYILLSQPMAEAVSKHVSFYRAMGLLSELPTAGALAAWMLGEAGIPGAGSELLRSLKRTLEEYNLAAATGHDEFEKAHFPNAPFDPEQPFYVGRVVPALHYCMGGLKIDRTGGVLRADLTPLPGLHAVGEVVGGVHGENRLGGNSLLDCVVFGQIVGEKLLVHDASGVPAPASADESGRGSGSRRRQPEHERERRRERGTQRGGAGEL